MTLTEVVRPGEKIELMSKEKAIKGNGSNRKVYVSKIYDIMDDEEFEILMPMEGTKLVLLPVDGEFQVCFYAQKGLYTCFIRVTDRYKDNNIYILLCEVTSGISKYQRREYYRYNTFHPFALRELLKEEEKAIEEKNFRAMPGIPLKKATIVDISGGGIRFMCDTQFPVGTDVFLTFTLIYQGKETVYELAGTILASKKHEIQTDMFEHRLMFIWIGNKEREEIIRYIFEEERKNRGKT
ncbi:MAG: flagellar brake protein [Lachnospiraceae bacterium]|nr:flagellar brake protein [Lachnospiraceae bacterium]